MKHDYTSLDGVVLTTPTIHEDERGYTFEAMSDLSFFPAKQQNVTFSKKHSLRGLHFQMQEKSGQRWWQGKIVRCLSGKIFDVVVDIVPSSPTCGSYYCTELDSRKHNSLCIPPGYAHGFYALEDSLVHYTMSDVYRPDCQFTIKWDDPDLNIPWPFETARVQYLLKISEKDQNGKPFKDSKYEICYEEKRNVKVSDDKMADSEQAPQN